MGLLVLILTAAATIIVIGTAALIHHMHHPSRRTFGAALARGLPTDPTDLGLAAQERTFRFDDGATSPGWVIEGQAPTGPTVIVTHGWSDSRYGALTRVPLVAPHASRIVVYDLRAHGDSSARRAELTRIEPDDLLAVMDQADDGSPFVLLGYSLGAGVTIVAAAREFEQRGESARIAGVIVEAPYRWPMQPLRGYLWRKRLPPQPFVWLAGRHLAFWRGLTNAAFDRAAHAAKLKCSLLVLHGTADRISPFEAGQQIAAAAPKGRLVPFEGVDHVSLAQADEGRYREALTVFFPAAMMMLDRA